MEIVWDIVKVILTSLVAGAAALVPFFIYMRREREEKAKISAETTNISADATQKIVTAAGDLQDAYVELINDMKSRTAEYKQEIHDLSNRLEDLEKSNKELNIKVDETNRQLEESKIIIIELVEGIRLLTSQVEGLGQQPIFKPKTGGQ